MTGYMADMRRLGGHRTVIQCAASIIVIDAQGRLLLGKRSDDHLWGYSGGSVEIDERVEECARRELREEMGIIAGELEFFCVNSGPEAHHIYPNGDEDSNIEVENLCRAYAGEPKNSAGEMERLRFFKPEAIDLDLISPPIRPVLRRYLEQHT